MIKQLQVLYNEEQVGTLALTAEQKVAYTMCLGIYLQIS
jgi:hypothetical protein